MPVILMTKAEYETWLTAPVEKALKLQRPLADKIAQGSGDGREKGCGLAERARAPEAE